MWLCVGSGKVGSCAFTFRVLEKPLEIKLGDGGKLNAKYVLQSRSIPETAGISKKSEHIDSVGWLRLLSYCTNAICFQKLTSYVFLIHYLLSLLPKHTHLGVLTHPDWLGRRRLSCEFRLGSDKRTHWRLKGVSFPFTKLVATESNQASRRAQTSSLAVLSIAVCSGLQRACKLHGNGWFLSRNKHVLWVFQMSQTHAVR